MKIQTAAAALAVVLSAAFAAPAAEARVAKQGSHTVSALAGAAKKKPTKAKHKKATKKSHKKTTG